MKDDLTVLGGNSVTPRFLALAAALASAGTLGVLIVAEGFLGGLAGFGETHHSVLAGLCLAVSFGSTFFAYQRIIGQPLARLVGSVLLDMTGKVSRYSLQGVDEIGVIARSHDELKRGFEQERERAERDSERLRHLANHDPLTNTANRHSFHERLGAALEGARDGKMFAVLLIDLDHFKEVNDQYGHPFGDELLRIVASRLKHGTAAGDVVGRIGGDEFGVIQMDLTRMEDAGALAKRICRMLSEPYHINGQTILNSASVGIALAPEDSLDLNEILVAADLALCAAKAEGRNGYRYFEQRLAEQTAHRKALQQELKGAIDRGELELHYQPIVDAEQCRPVSFEALLRWHNPARGSVPPGIFIPIAEETNLIVEIGEWVLRTACKQAAGWPGSIGISVNVSPAQFRNTGFAEIVADALSESGLAAGRLQLEITETLLLSDLSSARIKLDQLKSLGCKLSLDDFGTGYSSLVHMRRFPIDTIKIDRSFVSEFGSANESRAIAAAIVHLARELGMTTTAEGVETREQLEMLRLMGCSFVQGYLISKPVVLSKAEEFLLRNCANKDDALALPMPA